MPESKPTQKDIEVVLKSILGSQPSANDVQQIDAIRRIGHTLYGSSFDPLEGGERLTHHIEGMVKDSLSTIRMKWQIEAFDEDWMNGEEQIKRDFEPGKIELEEWSVLWAHYIYGYKRVEIVRIVSFDIRTYDLRLKQGREKLTRLIITQGDKRPVPSVEPFPAVEPVPETAKNDPVRQHLLDTMRADWIESFYEKSLEQRARIILRMVNRPDTVEGPWEDVEQGTAQPDGTQSLGTTIVDVWEAYRHALLILGEAGVGKTIALLELADVLLERAYADATKPVPVYVHLASWHERHGPLHSWVLREFKARYGIKSTWTQQALDTHTIVLLLDGLDEVPEGQQAACIEAINAFRAEYGMIDIALCYRLNMPEQGLPLRPHLRAAVQLQPLSPAEIKHQLMTVSNATQDDLPAPDSHPLYELLATPLMLDTYVTTFGTMQPHTLVETTLPAFRRNLFDAYIEKMFKRRKKLHDFEQVETLRWLAWLANQMVQHNSTFFEIERLDSSWLPDGERVRFVRTVRLWRALVLGIALGLPATSALMIMFVDIATPWFAVQFASWHIVVALVLGCALMMVLLSVVALRKITQKSQERIHPVEEVFHSKPIRWSWVFAATFLELSLL